MSGAAPIARLLPGVQVYKYSLKHRIGSGSFGEVWLATDNGVGHDYAIKILRPGIPMHERLREAHIGHSLMHNNLVRVHQADVVNGLVIIAMDHLPEGAITKLANPSGYLTLPEVLRIGIDILRGLEYLHGQNFFHNDVKPENVLIGPGRQGMLSDYGIVGISTDGSPVPPPNSYKIHSAPEVVNNIGINAQTDIFQAGMTIFRMLVGLGTLRDKFTKLGEAQYYQAICDAKLVTLSDFPAYVPSKLKRIVLKALSPSVTDRYVSALDMRRDLERLSYAGYWTVASSGAFVGHNGAHEFRFEHQKVAEGKFNVTAFKKSKATQRETRISKFCASGVTNTQSTQHIERFVKAVVNGI
ncbi:MAG: serine/threonine protein kinase [Rhodocyclaceae bacterium]|jgi:serine/threonine protein kinase|nr:serine/threonine protein kinase [Rhodocyclaceae bacterium]